MKLINLEVLVDNEVRRFVKFHDGLNLITNKPNSGRTGNSVGKSTLSRVMDFLMLGNISSIYIDEEFKKPNKEIETLFMKSNVLASLSFFDSEKNIHKISRSLKIDSEDQLYFIDGEDVESKKYESFIQDKMFNIQTRRPTVRSIAPKFIRNNSHRMLSTTKFLDKNSGSKDYSELFLYLFGFKNTALLTEKRDATNLIGRRKRNTQSINALIKEQKPSNEIKSFKLAAKELEENLLEFDYSPEYTNPIGRLSELQNEENELTEKLLSIDRMIENINRTIKLLSQDEGSYLINQLKAIYDFSGVAVDSALRDLEDVVSFHSNLVQQKKNFLSIDMPNLVNEKEGLIIEINAIIKNKNKVFSDVKSKESLENITKNLKTLGQLKVELGKLEGLLEQQKKAKLDFDLAEKDLSLILDLISKEIENVYIFEKVFNKHLSKITKKIHDDSYEIDLNFNDKSGICSIEMMNAVTNPEGGKKKAEVIAFDFAYIYAADELAINRPYFVFHDSIEDIDKNQIEDIFSIAKLLPGQQILSMLSDKIDDKIYKSVENNVVLLLDEKEKFFGV